jgi:hypothetical protein
MGARIIIPRSPCERGMMMYYDDIASPKTDRVIDEFEPTMLIDV